jgi:DNA (cytosine-5)-methyltransferase 1
MAVKIRLSEPMSELVEELGLEPTMELGPFEAVEFLHRRNDADGRRRCMSTLTEAPSRIKTCHLCIGIGTLEATDIFCGAGGSSLGLELVCCPGCGRQLIKVTQALNHWDLAVQAHNANFPDADHDVHDVEEIPPSRFRRTDIFWASPECTHQAYCRGPKEYTEDAFRSRATFADIIRFTKHHRYDAVIVENVIEARLWCDELGHAKGCSCGETFDAWFKAMSDIGYGGQIVYFNSQFANVPQSRDRMYVVFWRNGVRQPNLDFRPVSWCSSCQTIVRGIQSWKPASKGSAREKIFEWGRYGSQYLYCCDRCASPVAPAVRGAKTIVDWTIAMQRIGDRARPLADNTRKRIRVGIENIGRRVPIQVQVGGNLFERQGYARVWALDDPLRTVTGTPYMSLVVPGKSDSVPHDVQEPMPSVTTHAHAAVVRVGGQSPAPSLVDEPMGTITAHDRQRALIVQNMSHCAPRDVETPTPPVTTGGNHMLVQVNRGGDTRPPRDLRTPMPTVAGHGECGIVSLRNHDSGRSIDEPATTVSAGGNHHGLLVYNGVPGFVRELDDTAGTVTGRDKQSLLVPYYTTGVARPTEMPTSTVSTRDREALVVTEADIDDCLFRMLQWPELLKAQTMNRMPDGRDYQLTARRKNKRGQFVELSNELRTKMIGNAVSSHVACMLGTAVMEALI